MDFTLIAIRVCTGQTFFLTTDESGLITGMTPTLSEARQYADGEQAEQDFKALIDYVRTGRSGGHIVPGLMTRFIRQQFTMVEVSLETAKVVLQTRRRAMLKLDALMPANPLPRLKTKAVAA